MVIGLVPMSPNTTPSAPPKLQCKTGRSRLGSSRPNPKMMVTCLRVRARGVTGRRGSGVDFGGGSGGRGKGDGVAEGFQLADVVAFLGIRVEVFGEVVGSEI